MPVLRPQLRVLRATNQQGVTADDRRPVGAVRTGVDARSSARRRGPTPISLMTVNSVATRRFQVAAASIRPWRQNCASVLGSPLIPATTRPRPS